MKYTEKQFEEAKVLVLKKWQWIINNYDIKFNYNANKRQLIIDIPELDGIPSACVFCQLVDVLCEVCPIVLFYDETEACHAGDSTFDKWRENATKTNARKMYKLLKKITWEGIKDK